MRFKGFIWSFWIFVGYMVIYAWPEPNGVALTVLTINLIVGFSHRVVRPPVLANGANVLLMLYGLTPSSLLHFPLREMYSTSCGSVNGSFRFEITAILVWFITTGGQNPWTRSVKLVADNVASTISHDSVIYSIKTIKHHSFLK